MSSTFAYEGHAARLNLHSFPTRRSSDLVGTICGDDTLFVAVRDAADAPAFARTLQGSRSDRNPWSVRANAGASAASLTATNRVSSPQIVPTRSEERRVGKECRFRRAACPSYAKVLDMMARELTHS